MQQETKTSNITLFILLLAIHAVYFLLACDYKQIYNGDSFEYIYAAVNLKERSFFYSGNPAMPIEPEYLTFRTPLYPLFLAFFYTFGLNNWVILAIQNLLSVCNILLARNLLFAFNYKQRYDWILLLLLLAWPTQFIHANIIKPEILLQSCVLIYIHQLLAFWREKRAINAWGVSIALIAGLMVKPVLYPFTVVHLAIMIALWVKDRHLVTIAKFAIAGLLPILSIVAYNGWNATRTGKFHFTSNQSFNAIYYFYYYKSATEGIPAARKMLQEERQHMANIVAFKDRYEYAQNRGQQLIKENITGYLPYHILHSFRFFIDPGKGDMDLFTGKLTYRKLYSDQTKGFRAYISEDGWVKGGVHFAQAHPSIWFVLLIALINVIKLIGVGIFLVQRNIPVAVRLFLLLFLGYFALITGPISTPRYVLPVSLLIIGAATIGFQLLIQNRNPAKNRGKG